MLVKLISLLRSSRFGVVYLLLFSLLALQFLQRIVMLFLFAPKGLPSTVLLKILSIGFVMDLFVGTVLCIPLILYLTVAPTRTRLWRKIFHNIGLILFWGFAIFFIVAEVFFFDRFNTVAVDYLLYPHEVFFSIWELYPVVWVIIGCAIFSVLWLIAARSLLTAKQPQQDLPVLKRAAVLIGFILAAAVLWQFVGNRLTRFSQDRIINEISGNGWYSFVQAALTRELEYEPFYRTCSREQAYEQTRKLLDEPDVVWDTNKFSIKRFIKGDPSRPKLNVIILLEESLGSEFFGCLGRNGESLTPNLDRLVQQEGLIFTNIYATGNRTVRGMESVLCGFPPLPGDSIVVRPHFDHTETLARVLKRDGYSTEFIYAGRAIFDNIRFFMGANGYDRVIERKHFSKPTFETIWGVCNEDLYDRCIEEARLLSSSGKPFFITTLSVSNHKPFTYPEGRIPEDPKKRRRDYAVKYTDYAIGRFLEKARNEPFWTNTIFVVVADHGARVYGKQTIPMKSYEVPFIIFGPAVVKEPRKIGILGSQLDVAPTILGLIGRPYESLFFGRNLLKLNDDNGRSLLHHNRDIGLYEKDHLVVLGLNKSVEYYHGNPKIQVPEKVKNPDNLDREVLLDATAMFQVAWDLYAHTNYCLKN
ncbi:MAG: LTA synthase family protein [Verrucomicrobiia bacterium]